MPFGFELRPASPIPGYPTALRLRARSVALPESVIPGLVAVAVMAPENAGLRLDHDGPWLSFRNPPAGQRVVGTSTRTFLQLWATRSRPHLYQFGEDESGEPTATLTIGDGTPAASIPHGNRDEGAPGSECSQGQVVKSRFRLVERWGKHGKEFYRRSERRPR